MEEIVGQCVIEKDGKQIDMYKVKWVGGKVTNEPVNTMEEDIPGLVLAYLKKK